MLRNFITITSHQHLDDARLFTILITRVSLEVRSNFSLKTEHQVLEGPLAALNEKIASGELERNERQLLVASQLNRVYRDVKNVESEQGGLLNRLFSARRKKNLKGLYIHGAVGGGKTMLMDIFYNSCSLKEKQRVHFNEFMIDVHKKMHILKQNDTMDFSDRKSKPFDPIPSVARAVLDSAWLICFDEFQVTDIADAMILRHLFTELFNKGAVVIATSNRPPEDLYKNGLQRSNFIPFIQVLKDHCEVTKLDSGVDYRQLVKGAKTNFFVKTELKLDPLEKIFKVLCSKENDIVRTRTINILGRDVSFRKTCGGVLDTSFEELCDRPLGANDYLHLAQFFHTIIIRDVPEINLVKMRSSARRFITLIDVLYDHRVKIIMSADVPLPKLFSFIKSDELSDEQRMLMDDFNIGSQDMSVNILTGEEELFAFDRTMSRLTEMQNDSYWSKKRLS